MPKPARLMPCLSLLLAGCYSTSIAQTPSTVPRGALRWGVGMEVDAGTATAAGLSPELSLRAGALERVDVGVKANFSMVEVGVKGQLVRGDFDLSVAASGAVSRDEDDDEFFDENADTYDWMRSGRAMLIAGQRMSNALDLVLMGDAQYGLRSGGEAWTEHFTAVGGGIGVLFKGVAQALPEIVVTQVIDGHSARGHTALQAGQTRVQITLTGLIGGSEEKSSR